MKRRKKCSERRLVSAWAERCSGPGWANYVIWTLWQLPSGLLSMSAIQPQEQTDEMRTLFNVAAACADQMKLIVASALSGKPKKARKK